MAKPKPAKMLAVLGRCRRTGRWRVGARSTVLAVLGSCRLDMRSSFAEDGATEMKMQVTVFLGSAVFILPDGAEVRPSGMSLLSAETVDVPEHPEASGLPTLDIEWTCVFGRVKVVTGPAMDRLELEGAEARSRRSPRHWRKLARGPRSAKGATSAPAPVSAPVSVSDLSAPVSAPISVSHSVAAAPDPAPVCDPDPAPTA